MKIFVAGATGTIGLPLVRELVKRNHEVTGLTRSNEKRAMLENAGAQAAVADALDLTALKTAIVQAAPDCVVHLLTAIPPNGPVRASDMNETNRLRIEGTKNLLAAAAAANAKRFVAESMVFVYGFKHARGEILTEQSPVDSAEEKSWLQDVADALRSLEAQLAKAGRDGLIQSVALRYGLIYGAESPSTRYLFKMIKKRFLPMVKGVNGISPFVHLDDAVSATVAVVEREKVSPVYNIVDDEAVEMNDWIRCAADVLQAKKPLTIPLWLLKLFSPYTAAMLDSSVVASNEKAKSELGWQPQFPNYRRGLAQAVKQTELSNKL